MKCENVGGAKAAEADDFQLGARSGEASSMKLTDHESGETITLRAETKHEFERGKRLQLLDRRFVLA
jgi:hypothetical protein